jgi:hypothetical protein
MKENDYDCGDYWNPSSFYECGMDEEILFLPDALDLV